MVKAYHIETYGCQMNFGDSELIETILGGEGMTRAGDEDSADIILINTCGVREHAEQRVLGRLGHFLGWKRRSPGRLLAVLGCMAQRMGEDLLQKAPWVDLVAGPDSYRSLPVMLREASLNAGGPRAALTLDKSETYSDIRPLRDDTSSAWVPITRGCDNFCSYCIVPYVRGRERSVEPEAVEAQVRDCVERGIREVVLLGQNVNSYRHGETGFAELLRRLDRVEGLQWIRFLTSHPRDLSDRIIEALAECPRVVEHLHLPAQSGSDKVLDAMNRGYTRDYYLGRVARLRELIPDIALTTDILVGFPGESDNDFLETVSLMEEVRFDYAYTYKYSSRPGTRAAGMPDNLPTAVKQDRLDRVINLQRDHTRTALDNMLGLEIDVLPVSPARSGKNTWLAKTRTHFNMFLGCDISRQGQLIRARVTGSTGMGLTGETV